MSGRLQAVRGIFGRDLPLLATLVAYVSAGYILHRTTGVPDRIRVSFGSWQLLLQWVVIYAIGGVVLLLGHRLHRRSESLRELATWKRVAGLFFKPRPLMRFLLVLLLVPLFMSTFIAFKTSIPDLVPFSWDYRFMEWDRLVHFGNDPWAILHPLLGHPWMTGFLDRVYYTWFPVVWLTFIWQLLHGQAFSDGREQYLLAFALCWIVLGTILATLLSSVGPVYYANVVDGANPFVPLLGYLGDVNQNIPLTALRAQDILWGSYADPGMSQVEGISAMPSLHVAMVTLMVLLGFRVARWLGWAFLIYAVLVLLGSVHLAWHYAIDGYVAVVGAIAIWHLAGRTQAWWERRAATREAPA